MKIEINEIDLNAFYIKAKRIYNKLISDKENEFLKEEVNIPLESILVIENNVEIVFSKNVADGYLLKVNFVLLEEEKEIGRYTYVEDEKKQVVDDYLVFY